MNIEKEQQYWLETDFVSELIELLPTHIFWKNKNGVYLGCNKAFAQSLGLSSPDDIIGKSDYDLPVKKEISEGYRRDDQAVMLSQTPKLNIEEEQVFLDGRKTYLLTSKVPIFNKQHNEILGILGLYSDVTELKTAQKKAEIASRAKSEFIANISHDIRTPITGMLGLIQEIIDRSEDPIIHEDAGLLISATDELLQLLNEVIETVRIESESIKKEKESFDLLELLHHNLNLLRPAAHHKKLLLKLEVNASENVLQRMYGYKLYLDRVLLNLLSNAVKFTEQGHITVKVQLLTSEKKTAEKNAETKLQILVQDTGIGIPKEAFNSIFEHFSRLTPSYQGVYKGSGLGLYTVKRYVKAMNASIDVESELGKGTCFTLTLPFILSEAKDQRPRTTNVFRTTVSKDLDLLLKKHISQNGPIKVLVVEDNVLAARSVTSVMSRLGCEIDVVINGAEALKKIMTKNYNLILMDIGLPDIDGFELTKAIRSLSDEHSASVPIVALTGHVDEEKQKECHAAGMQTMLTKPIHLIAAERLLKRFVFQLEEKESISNVVSSAEKQLMMIDLEEGARLLGGDRALAQEILDLFAKRLKLDEKELTSAYRNGDAKAFRDELHKFYGGLCYVGAPRLRASVQKLREATVRYDQAVIEKCYQKLMQEIQKFLQAYNQ